MTYKIYINDRNYLSWDIHETGSYEKRNIDINPLECKLFSNDIFTVENNTVKIIHSCARTTSSIAAVLILADNKSYGRVNKAQIHNPLKKNTNTKLLYKCIPDDIHLPCFLVPYEMKNMGFSKVFKNLYVTITYNEWKDKHPLATLNQVIGVVDILHNFYEYQLYCKNLNNTMHKFQKDTSRSLEIKTNSKIASKITSKTNNMIDIIKGKITQIEDRTSKEWHILTIDAPNTSDIDDAFSINYLDNSIIQLSIYISNVTIWMDVLNLWDSFTRRISTIYLPDKKRPMLPNILSEGLCSLQENTTRIAFVMDIFIKEHTIIDIKYCNSYIKVFKNYAYEETALLSDYKYHELLEVTKKLSRSYSYLSNVRNSYELVSYLMIFMNHHTALELLKYKTGIFRATTQRITTTHKIVPNDVNEDLLNSLPEDVLKFIKIWKSATGYYINGSEVNVNNSKHETLNVNAYIHITSPIRRLVDLLNMIKLQQCLGIIDLSANINSFYEKWVNELDYINSTMRTIHKVQSDCALLDLCNNNTSIITKEYDSYTFDKIVRDCGLFQYTVFIPSLKLLSRVITTEEIENYSHKKCKLYLFNNEEKFKKKIRVQLC